MKVRITNPLFTRPFFPGSVCSSYLLYEVRLGLGILNSLGWSKKKKRMLCELIEVEVSRL